MLDWASAETFFAVGVGCMGMGMDGCSVSIFYGVWASSRTIPRWEIFILFYCDLRGFVLLCSARESRTSTCMCGEERVQNGCMSMHAERVWLVWMRGIGTEVGDIVLTG